MTTDEFRLYCYRRSIIDHKRRAKIDPRLKTGYLKSVWNTFKGDGRMIRSGLILMIKDLAGKGKSAYAIGQEIGVSKNTARKYMTQPAQPHGLKGIKKGSKLDPYKEQLDSLMQQGVFNCVVLLERLRALGYDGGMSILKEYVHPYRPAKSAPAVRRYETPSGKQAQMDWGICQYLDQDGVLHKVAVFVMILGHSRAKYIEFVSRCDLRSMERCMLNAFLYFGGVPKEVLTDNMKTVVAGREAGKVIWNAQFADFAVEMGFVPKVCRVRMPQTKGKVERLVRYVKENFFPGRSFTDLEDLNQQALSWCKAVDSKPHGTTGKIPLQVLATEELLPLPAQEIQDRYRWERRTVTREGLVSFDGIRYGVPWQYSGKEVQVRMCSGHLEIYYGEMLLAKHQVQYHAGKMIWLPGQYKGLMERKGIATPYPAALQQDVQVEVRPLNFYDRLLGGAAHG